MDDVREKHGRPIRASVPGPARLATAAVVATGLSVAACADPAAPTGVDLELETVAEGLAAPVFLTQAPDDPRRVFIVEKAGRIRVVRDGALLAEPFLDIAAETSDGGERGLLGLAFDPAYADNGRFFVDHTNNDGDTRVLRYTAATPDVADPASGTTILEVEQPFENHNGGHLAFGPDGMLYVGLGDGGSGGDPHGNGQNASTLLGSILRIDVDGASPYAIPPDNPFAGDADAAPEIWVYGLRNPWRFSFDRATGDLYIGDVGESAFEEISHLAASMPGGANFGWNVLEGTSCYDAPTCDDTGRTAPVYEYPHAEGCSVTGGYVYRGSALPGLDGRYLFGDFCSGWIRSFRLSGGTATDVVEHSVPFSHIPQLASFAEDADGELYVLSLEGSVYRIVAGSSAGS